MTQQTFLNLERRLPIGVAVFSKAGDHLLIVDLGVDLRYSTEPLRAPPEDQLWSILWSSESPTYGGSGTASLQGDENWRIPRLAAVVLAPLPLSAALYGEVR